MQTGNIVPDDFDEMMKSWRNNNPQHNFDDSVIDTNDISSFPQRSSNKHKTQNQMPSLTNPVKMKQESFSVSMYLLLTLTLAVIILFLNCYRRRNPIRARRNFFAFNKLGLYA